MSDKIKLSNIDDSMFNLDFLSEKPINESLSPKDYYTLLIVDDEDEIHKVTSLVLSNFEFEGKGLKILSAYGELEARKILEENKDIAVILLDVVMEEEDSGLKLVNHIRNVMKNSKVRIILRTGQPGKAPEDSIIKNFDINDYKAKTELTVQKLNTSLYSALRSYRDLEVIERSKKGLSMVIEATKDVLKYKRINHFAEGIFSQLSTLISLTSDSIFARSRPISDSLFLMEDQDEIQILGATGHFKDCKEQSLPPHLNELIKTSVEDASIYRDDFFFGAHILSNGSKNYIYMEGVKHLSPLDFELLDLFLRNFSLIFDNFNLNNEIITTQKDVISFLGNLLESRAEGLDDHVKKVSSIARNLALKLGLSENDADLLESIAPLHDVGKIGILDSILLKPARLTPEEFEIMKTHTTLGYNVLKNNKRPLLASGAIIAHQHHERWDGRGYPQGLSGEEIHIFARILTASDIFDALLSKRPYKDPWEPAKVKSYFIENRGLIFDPQIADLVISNFDELLSLIS